MRRNNVVTETARTPRQVFGAMLRYYRKRACWSRTELARQISKSVSLIQAIELGQRAATADVTEDLERVLPADGALTRLRDEIGDGLGYQAYPSWFQEWLASSSERQNGSAGSSRCWCLACSRQRIMRERCSEPASA